MNSVVICDLDSTLFNIDHRLHFLKEKDWEGFYAAVKDDTPNQWCVELLRALDNAGYNIVFISGRNMSAYKATVVKLNEIGISSYALSMRAEDDRRPDFELKKEYANKYLKNINIANILFAIEDRKRVVDMYRDMGITVLQCAEGEF